MSGKEFGTRSRVFVTVRHWVMLKIKSRYQRFCWTPVARLPTIGDRTSTSNSDPSYGPQAVGALTVLFSVAGCSCCCCCCFYWLLLLLLLLFLPRRVRIHQYSLQPLSIGGVRELGYKFILHFLIRDPFAIRQSSTFSCRNGRRGCCCCCCCCWISGLGRYCWLRGW
jgi:hypothetical protein